LGWKRKKGGRGGFRISIGRAQSVVTPGCGTSSRYYVKGCSGGVAFVKDQGGGKKKEVGSDQGAGKTFALQVLTIGM